MKSSVIRQKFFDFFKKHDHTRVPSSSLIPAQDPTLLFANAGMNQFKDVFLGKEQRSYKRAVSIQKCIRAGGKHNDLDNVGFTKRHLTFFEMMGNFSFGDYFKKDAIRFAWDFLTKEIGLPAEKLSASVYLDDNEAYNLWHTEIGLPEDKIVRLGSADNFWQMGDVGPCGPCTEIYFDRGAEHGCGTPTCKAGCSCDRFMEIWNLVFMQFNRQPDGTDIPLTQTGVDTGMGLERLCAVVQNKDSVFDTDLFAPLIAATEKASGKSYAQSSPELQAAFRVIADHIRSSCLAIADGCTPSNEGRGYVLRKIIRRAALFAQKLGENTIFPEIAHVFIDDMGALYPELETSRKLIISLLTSEIEKFAQNLVNGQIILQKYMAEQKDSRHITGTQAFKLYDTYGFPLEVTELIARENKYTVDSAAFEKEMEQQRLQSGKKQITTTNFSIPDSLSTEFTGYTELETITTITALLTTDGSPLEEAPAGTDCWIVTPQSPLYVECGGQVNDTALVTVGTKSSPVLALKKLQNVIVAKISAPETLTLGTTVTITVNKQVRENTMKNHTATHLLQAALVSIFGKQVKQSGSLVTPEYLRFDFTYHETVTPEQLAEIERIINAKIMENIPTDIRTTTYQDALKNGVTAFFGEKYNPDNVRVVAIPGFSAELCGGTHVRATGDIGIFKITELSALSAGNKRIVAVTGPQALELFQQTFTTVKQLSTEFKVQPTDIVTAIEKQKNTLKTVQLHLKTARKKLFELQAQTWLQENKKFIYHVFHDATSEELKDLAVFLRTNGAEITALFSSAENRCNYVIAVAQNKAEKTVLEKIQKLLQEHGLKGGIRDGIFQGGGVQMPALKDQLEIL